MARFFALTLAALAAQVQGQFTIDDTTYTHEWLPMTKMGMPRSDMTATTVADAIYIIGGCSGDQTYTSAWGGMWLGGTSCYDIYQEFANCYNADYSVASTQMMTYDPVNEVFAASYPLTQGRGDAAAAIANGVAFALGGFHHTNWSYPMDHLEVNSAASAGFKAVLMMLGVLSFA
eukprot:Skav209043  [mRNA]  locus=scaffold2483:133373:136613:+ [translate_table: standard]